jgi:hypothetical protein
VPSFRLREFRIALCDVSFDSRDSQTVDTHCECATSRGAVEIDKAIHYTTKFSRASLTRNRFEPSRVVATSASHEFATLTKAQPTAIKATV